MVHSHSSTASQRVPWVSQLLAHEGTYGEISQMSRRQRVSRQTLSAWKEKGQRALEAALAIPKSQSLMSPSYEMRMFGGDTSRWTMFRSWPSASRRRCA